MIPLLIPNPDKSLWFHIFIALMGILLMEARSDFLAFSYQVFVFETCSCWKCAVEEGRGRSARLSSPVLRQGKGGKKVIIDASGK